MNPDPPPPFTPRLHIYKYFVDVYNWTHLIRIVLSCRNVYFIFIGRNNVTLSKFPDTKRKGNVVNKQTRLQLRQPLSKQRLWQSSHPNTLKNPLKKQTPINDPFF